MDERPADLRPADVGGDLAAAVAGDPEAFRRLADPYTRELQLHCFRMLGSFHDAEDAVQETLLRAWLYRIATNVCLRQGRRKRAEVEVLPHALAEAVDIGKLVGLLKREVVLTMPPLPLRYTGREAVGEFSSTIPAGGALDRFRFLPTRANRQPALAVYRRDPDGRTYRAWGMFVLGLDGVAIAEISTFFEPALLPVFGLPIELEPSAD